MRNLLKLSLVAAAATFAISTPAAAQSGKISKKEEALSAAGFEPKPANTPERQEMLARLPAKKFTRRVNGDTTMYVYADPKGCNCLYVGDQDAYSAYQRTAQAKELADQQQATAQAYQDARWNWGAWGPWGPRWGRFGFGPGFGW